MIRKTPIIFEKSIPGPDKLTENVDDYEYTISPKSFWQSHKNAPSILLQQVISNANIKIDEVVCDLYGGVGLFTLPISKLVGNNGQVHLIEMDRTCIQDANIMFENVDNIFIHRCYFNPSSFYYIIYNLSYREKKIPTRKIK